MAYEKTTWAKGDVVTSAKLNKMEDGVAAAGSIACLATGTETLNITPRDIFDDNDNVIAVPILCMVDEFDGYPIIVPYLPDFIGVDNIGVDNNQYYISYYRGLYLYTSEDKDTSFELSSGADEQPQV